MLDFTLKVKIGETESASDKNLVTNDNDTGMIGVVRTFY